MGQPIAYFISFHTFGTWLHGDERGSVDRDHNAVGTPHLAPDAARQEREFERMSAAGGGPIVLDLPRRTIVERTIHEVCAHRGWALHIVNVRTNHVHVVVSGAGPPEPMMNSLKSWCTRRMVERGVHPRGAPAWTRHGSTRYLWDETSLADAVGYVRDMQGVDLRDRP